MMVSSRVAGLTREAASNSFRAHEMIMLHGTFFSV